MGLHGSPGDYAWGPQGLEDIISQMLANLEDNGPPPTQKEKLDSLPSVEATAAELKECKLACLLYCVTELAGLFHLMHIMRLVCVCDRYVVFSV